LSGAIRSALALTRAQILAFRRRASGLDARAPMSTDSLRLAAWAGLQDSMPRAALLSIHARVADTPPDVLDDVSLAQIWGPRYSMYVVASVDVAVFTLGRMPDDVRGRERAEAMARLVRGYTHGEKMPYDDVGLALGLHNANALRYGTATGTILIRWEGARRPLIWTIAPSSISVEEARLELARRYLHVFGPGNAESFAGWAGVSSRSAAGTFRALEPELTQVRSPIGDSWLLTADEAFTRAEPQPLARVRLLPSGDTYFLLQGSERELLVPDARRRAELWTSRVWPGALLVDTEITGVWRRAHEKMTIDLWRPLTSDERAAVEAEAASLPLPGLALPISVSFAHAA